MTYLGKLALGSAAALALSIQSPARAGSLQPPVHILCDGNELAPLCDGLRQALSKADETRIVTVVAQRSEQVALTLHFAAARHERHSLSGHLAWITPDGTHGEGPVMELSVIDAPLNDDLLRDFAHQLVQFTVIPL